MPGDLLRRHVFWRTEGRTLDRVRTAGQKRHTKIGDFHGVIVEHHNIGRLDIAMYHIVGVGKRQAVGNLRSNFGDTFKRQNKPGIQQLTQRTPGKELHGDIRQIVAASDVVDGYDIRMIEAPGGLCLSVKALLEGLGFFTRQTMTSHCLDRHGTLDQRIVRLIDSTHGAPPKRSGDFVTT